MVEIKPNKQHPLYQDDIKNILAVNNIQNLEGKRFLITGATGMVGVMLIDALMSIKGVYVIAIGRNKQKAYSRLGEHFENPYFKFIEHDVTEPFDSSIKVDYIIPAASNTHPLAYSQFPIETIMINVKGCEHALNLAQKCGAMVIYTSTNEIYGNAIGNEAFTEDYNGRLNLSNSRACYNESKRVSEALCQSYLAEKGVKVKIARLCRIFGPTMLESDTKASSQFIKKALAGEDIVLKSEGLQYFSYTYVADAVAGLLHVLLNGEIGQAYNISSTKTDTTLKDFAYICADVCGKKVVFDLPSDQEKKGFSIATTAILDNTKLLNSGFTPKYKIKEAIERTIRIINEGYNVKIINKRINS